MNMRKASKSFIAILLLAIVSASLMIPIGLRYQKEILLGSCVDLRRNSVISLL